MKTCSVLLLVAFLGVLLESAAALTLPISEDTFSAAAKPRKGQQTPAARQLTASAGKAKLLGISARQAAFVRFDIGAFAGNIQAATVDRAFLMVYLSKVARGGAIKLHTVSEDWTEAVASAQNEPGFNAVPVATVPGESVRESQFVVIDVTDTVKAWLSAPANEQGFALVGDATVSVEIGSKEGPASGYPAILQVERKVAAPAPAVDAEENLRIVRGTVLFKDGELSLVSGKGVTLTRAESPDRGVVITFTTPFAAPPTITIAEEAANLTGYILGPGEVRKVTATSAIIRDADSISGNLYHFIAIGPR